MCVDFEAETSEVVQIGANEVGTTVVHWALFQHGKATVHSQFDNAILYEGPFWIEEIAEDIGDDADCVWTTFKGGDDRHTWTGACTDPFSGLDSLSYTLELNGDASFYYRALVDGPGNWCAFDSTGGQYGVCSN